MSASFFLSVSVIMHNDSDDDGWNTKCLHQEVKEERRRPNEPIRVLYTYPVRSKIRTCCFRVIRLPLTSAFLRFLKLLSSHLKINIEHLQLTNSASRYLSETASAVWLRLAICTELPIPELSDPDIVPATYWLSSILELSFISFEQRQRPHRQPAPNDPRPSSC